MTIIADLFAIILQVITGMWQALLGAFESGLTIFYTDGAFTVLGALLLIPLGMSLVWFVFKFIRNLIAR